MTSFLRYIMLCCALMGTQLFALGLASFFVPVEGLRMNGEPIKSVEQRIAWMISTFLLALIGYRYFLVRTNYRFRFRTILAITTMIALTLGAAMSKQPSLNIVVFLGTWAICIYLSIRQPATLD